MGRVGFQQPISKSLVLNLKIFFFPIKNNKRKEQKASIEIYLHSNLDEITYMYNKKQEKNKKYCSLEMKIVFAIH